MTAEKDLLLYSGTLTKNDGTQSSQELYGWDLSKGDITYGFYKHNPAKYFINYNSTTKYDEVNAAMIIKQYANPPPGVYVPKDSLRKNLPREFPYSTYDFNPEYSFLFNLVDGNTTEKAIVNNLVYNLFSPPDTSGKIHLQNSSGGQVNNYIDPISGTAPTISSKLATEFIRCLVPRCAGLDLC